MLKKELKQIRASRMNPLESSVYALSALAWHAESLLQKG